MSWTVDVTIRNDDDSDVLCVIPKGQVFEHQRPGSGRQNVASSREYRLIVPGRSRITAEIDVLCINRSLSPPDGLPGNISIFKVPDHFATQDDLWRLVATPVL